MDRMIDQRRSSGFTLIELMIVVAIIAVLAAIAIPAYQIFVIRAQVAEGFSLATSGKQATAVYFGAHGEFPADNIAAGMAPPSSISGRYVESVTLGNANGDIVVLFGNQANEAILGDAVVLHATESAGSLSWSCTGLDRRYMPSNCN